ncbi:hypothetical protein B1F79_00245 [Coxiella-like endosymbiont of Rhipicephalus sanguineus]|nr:hypothetical protein [Coxiella-like endosymbiont of Rhipicephalus sanguineus]
MSLIIRGSFLISAPLLLKIGSILAILIMAGMILILRFGWWVGVFDNIKHVESEIKIILKNWLDP